MRSMKSIVSTMILTLLLSGCATSTACVKGMIELPPPPWPEGELEPHVRETLLDLYREVEILNSQVRRFKCE